MEDVHIHEAQLSASCDVSTLKQQHTHIRFSVALPEAANFCFCRFWTTHVPRHGAPTSLHESPRPHPLPVPGSPEDGCPRRKAQQPLARPATLILEVNVIF